MFHEFSEFFSKYKDTSFVNLNNGTLGLCPDAVIDQQKQHLELFERNTTINLGQAWFQIMALQERLAKFFGGSGPDFFLRPNVTLALNEIIMGLALPVKSEILTTTLEYGAVVNILKYKSEREGHSLRSMSLDFIQHNPSPQDWIDAVVRELKPATKLFVVSHVFTSNGAVAPVEELGKALRARGVIMVVDGAHAPGLMDLNFTQMSHVDFYGGNLHKWMMGPKGTAFGWVHPLWQDKTFPQYGSWTTNPETVTKKSYGDIHPFAARMLWSHSQSFSAYFALEACLDFWEQQGKQKIFSEIQKRMLYLEKRLEEEGLKPLIGIQQGALFLSYPLSAFSKISFRENFLLLTNNSVQVGLPKIPGLPVLRLTPHIHNSLKELDGIQYFSR